MATTEAHTQDIQVHYNEKWVACLSIAQIILGIPAVIVGGIYGNSIFKGITIGIGVFVIAFGIVGINSSAARTKRAIASFLVMAILAAGAWGGYIFLSLFINVWVISMTSAGCILAFIASTCACHGLCCGKRQSEVKSSNINHGNP